MFACEVFVLGIDKAQNMQILSLRKYITVYCMGGGGYDKVRYAWYFTDNTHMGAYVLLQLFTSDLRIENIVNLNRLLLVIKIPRTFCFIIKHTLMKEDEACHWMSGSVMYKLCTVLLPFKKFSACGHHLGIKLHLVEGKLAYRIVMVRWCFASEYHEICAGNIQQLLLS